MYSLTSLTAALAKYPTVQLGHLPTPLEPLPNLGQQLGLSLFVKRDDCTGIAFGGNKIRQLEFYFGQALSQGADTVLITGAVQSNFIRSVAAVAAKLAMKCHVQLEERVAKPSDLYTKNGNVLLDKLLGVTIHHFPEGENEEGADAALLSLAQKLREQGQTPYIIHLGPKHFPLGGYGYVNAAMELCQQLQTSHKTSHKTIDQFDEIFIGSGSALTHAGLLVGLRALGLNTPVRGVCVRRPAQIQKQRVQERARALIDGAGLSISLNKGDFQLFDGTLSPGYGMMSNDVKQVISTTAALEGLFLDPVYTGKVMAAIIQLAKSQQLKGKNILFWHTGGTPALFGYEDQLI